MTDRDRPESSPSSVASPEPEPGRGPEAESESESESGAAWPLWQRVGLRYLLLHWLLQSGATFTASLLGTIGGVRGQLLDRFELPWLDGAPFDWVGEAAMAVSRVEEWWQDATSWLSERGLAPYEVIHQRTGSGDTAHDITKLLVIFAAAALGALVWSLVRRAPCGYPRLGRWLHVLARFQLAFVMLSYGLHKFFGGQFGELGPRRLTTEVGDLWPMTMVGTFMQASKSYELFGGGGEVLGGLLLFHRRTALLGALVSIAVMSNVCALNWLHGVPVKVFSSWLLLTAVLLLAPFRHTLAAVFLLNRPSKPVDLRAPAPRGLRTAVVLAGWAWVLATLTLTVIQGLGPKPWMEGREKPARYGVWTVERMVLDGEEVPAEDGTRWRFLAIDRGDLVWAREATGREHFFRIAWDEDEGAARVRPAGAEDAEPWTWTVAEGTKVLPVDPPLLLRNEDRGRKVDGERKTLVLKGAWGERAVELHTVERRFRLQTGFRFRQELPDFW